MIVNHEVSLSKLAGLHFAYCCLGWTGPFRAWRWRAARDAARHVGDRACMSVLDSPDHGKA